MVDFVWGRIGSQSHGYGEDKRLVLVQTVICILKLIMQRAHYSTIRLQQSLFPCPDQTCVHC